jgi:hypothetical protein
MLLTIVVYDLICVYICWCIGRFLTFYLNVKEAGVNLQRIVGNDL